MFENKPMSESNVGAQACSHDPKRRGGKKKRKQDSSVTTAAPSEGHGLKLPFLVGEIISGGTRRAHEWCARHRGASQYCPIAILRVDQWVCVALRSIADVR